MILTHCLQNMQKMLLTKNINYLHNSNKQASALMMKFSPNNNACHFNGKQIFSSVTFFATPYEMIAHLPIR